MSLPLDLEPVIEAAWRQVRLIPGYVGYREFRALAMLHWGARGEGFNVEIGSFQGKSTIGLAHLSAHYGLGPVVSIDPHDAPCVTDPALGDLSSSFDSFQSALRSAGVERNVEIHRARSAEVAKSWNRPIRFLWIDGDHTWSGVKLDFDLFSPFLVDGAIIALHDTLHEFEGPIRVFVEEILRSDRFGTAGLFRSIGWARFCPRDGADFRLRRERLARQTAPLIPLAAGGRNISGFARMQWKLRRALIPHAVPSPTRCERLLAAVPESPRTSRAAREPA